MAGKTKINGTAYTVKGGKTKVNGTGYLVSKGVTKIGGAGKNISFKMKKVVNNLTSRTFITDFASTDRLTSGEKYIFDHMWAGTQYLPNYNCSATVNSNTKMTVKTVSDVGYGVPVKLKPNASFTFSYSGGAPVRVDTYYSYGALSWDNRRSEATTSDTFTTDSCDTVVVYFLGSVGNEYADNITFTEV